MRKVTNHRFNTGLLSAICMMLFALLLAGPVIFSSSAVAQYRAYSQLHVQQPLSVSDTRAVVSLDIEDMQLNEALFALSSKLNIGLSFNPDVILDVRVSLREENADVYDVLYAMLENTNLEPVFPPTRDVLMIREKESQAPETAVYMQTVSISGVVTHDGLPLVGVTVVAIHPGDQIFGTATDLDGTYSLEVPASATALRFSFIGMLTQEIEIDDRTTINVELQEVVGAMDEVIVVAYGEQRLGTLTGSSARVTGEQIQTMPNPSLAQRLEGRAPGVRVAQGSSITGASAAIRIRGSLREPLYVIDDVVVDKRDFDNLTSDEIESINIMKDAATASIYGARASDGVIVVRTRRGRFEQAPRFRYNATYNTQFLPTNIDKWQVDWDDYVTRMRMYQTFGDANFTDQEWQYLEQNPDFRGFGSSIDWLYQRPVGLQQSLSAEGGSQNVSYFTSVGWQSDEAMFPAAGYDQYNGRVSINARVHPNIRIEWTSDGFVEESQRPYWQYTDGQGVDEGMSDMFAVMEYDPDYVFGVIVDEAAGVGRIAQPSEINHPNFQWAGDAAWRMRSIVDRSAGYRDNTWRRFNNRLNLNWDLSSVVDGLSVGAMGSYRYQTRMFVTNAPYISRYTPTRSDPNIRWLYHNDLSQWQYQERFAINVNIPQINQTMQTSQHYQTNAFVNYVNSFGLHNVTAVGLFEYAGSYGWNMSGGRQNPRIDGVFQLFNYSGAREDTWFSGSENQYSRASFAGRVNYNYDERYIVEFSFRNDASYLFPRETRWGFFPSISAAWNIDQEAFFDVSWINSLKPRVSYGTSGSEGGISPFQFQHSYNLTGGWRYGSGAAPGLRYGVQPNPNITWAKTEAVNIGLDFGLFDNKLTGGFDLFKRWNSDILGTRTQQFPSTWGASLPAVNYAANEIQGLEMFVNHVNRVGNVTINLSANWAYAIDKVTKLDENPEIAGTWRSAIGRPSAQIWGYQSLGVITTQEELDALPEGFRQFGRVPEIGDLLLLDHRGVGYSDGPDGRVDIYDQMRLSENGSPRITFGFSLGGAWKGFSMDAQFSGVGAFDKMYRQHWGPGGIWRNPQFQAMRWHPEFNPSGELPALRGNMWGMPERGHGPTSAIVYNSAYLRLKNLTFAYDVPLRLVNSIGIDGMRVHLTGTDLFTITKWPFDDPETATGTSYPRMRSVSAGVNVNF